MLEQISALAYVMVCLNPCILFLFYFLDNEESLCHISRILWKRLERMILRYMSIAYSSHSILIDDT